MRSLQVAPVLGGILLLSLAGCTMKTPLPTSLPDAYILQNGRIWTANPAMPWAEAIYVQKDRIVVVGDLAQVLAAAPETTRIFDLDEAMVTPGFIDAHVHFLTGGFGLSSVQLRKAGTPETFINRIAAFAQSQPPGTWILGGDWDHEQWGGTLPHRSWIDSVTTQNPVWINRLDGHMALANSAAMYAAGITAATQDVFGGTIERDEDGTPTGIFKDNAMPLVSVAIPPDTPEQEDQALNAAMAHVNAHGVTSVHHMGSIEQVAVFERARDTNRLTTRIYAATELHRWEELVALIEDKGTGDDLLKIGALKGFVDGSLGSHTASFLEPFSDSPDESGFFVNDAEMLQQWILDADAAGLHLITHAIGDRAIRELLDIYALAGEQNGARDRRFRIEHAQHVAPSDLPRFARLQVIPSMQPYHAIDDGRWAERVIGPERIKTTYAFRSLLDAGARIAFGSDWFVAPPFPLEGIYAAVTRQTLDGANPDGWVPEQKITVEEALKAYTIDAAYAGYAESTAGSLEAGKKADFVILEQDLTDIPANEIRDIRILMTVFDGNTVYTSSP